MSITDAASGRPKETTMVYVLTIDQDMLSATATWAPVSTFADALALYAPEWS